MDTYNEISILVKKMKGEVNIFFGIIYDYLRLLLKQENA